MDVDLEAAYDAVCKRVLSEKMILAWIMKECLEEYRECGVEEIAQKYIEGEPEVSEEPVFPDEALIRGLDTEDKSADEGNVTYDVRFHALLPGLRERIHLIVNIEAQNDFYPGYPLMKRGIYYCARMLSAQHGREFTQSHYERLRKVYSVWICMKPPQGRRNTIVRYRMMEENLVGEAREPVENYDLLSTIMVCLGEPDGAERDSTLKLLDVLFSSEMNKEEKRRILKDEFSIPVKQEFEREVSEMCNLSKGILEKGIEKGILSSLQSLMETMGLNVEQAMEALKIPKKDQEKYIELLEQ